MDVRGTSGGAGATAPLPSLSADLLRAAGVAGAGELVRPQSPVGKPLVHRCAIDHWQHLGTSVRKTAEVRRSWLGRQERWCLWRPLDVGPPDDREACHLSASTVDRWLDQTGQVAQQTVLGQLVGVPTSGHFGTDGLWARLRGGAKQAKRVLLALVDSVSGLVWPPVTVDGEAAPAPWETLFRRADVAGLDLHAVRGLTSDGAPGLEAYRRAQLPWVSHQRCVFHLWRGLASAFAQAVTTATTGLTGATATATRRQTRRVLLALVRAVFNASSWAAAEVSLATLAAHELGAPLADAVHTHLDATLIHLCGYNAGLLRVGPEWVWRDFRLRLSHGRNQGYPHWGLRLGAAPRAGGVGLGHLPQLRARSEEVRA